VVKKAFLSVVKKAFLSVVKKAFLSVVKKALSFSDCDLVTLNVNAYDDIDFEIFFLTKNFSVLLIYYGNLD